MSKNQQIIMISPPKFLKERNSERIISQGHVCSYCQGNGYFWKEDSYGEPVKDPCPVCKGNKKLKAVINIRWEAEEIK